MSTLQDIAFKVQGIVDSSTASADFLYELSKSVDLKAKEIDDLIAGYPGASDIAIALQVASSSITTAADSLVSAGNTGSDWISEQVGSAKQRTLTR